MTTPTTLRLPALAGAVCLLAAAAGSATPSDAAPAAARSTVQRLEATLRPSGDPDGSGQAHVRLNKARRLVCATIEWSNIETPDSAHIHRASTGAVVVDLSGAVTGGAHCARGVRRSLITDLLAHPRHYYVNVHNPTYPAGAIQGPLHH
ncbi:MAG: CHRD domain-containing protein [Nocardioides sp.]